MKIRGLALLDFIDLLDKHGYHSIEAIKSFVVDPMKWPPKQWHFAHELIQRCTGLTEKQIAKLKPPELLNAFNEAMRKTGLVIQLTQTTRITEEQALKTPKADVVFQSG